MLAILVRGKERPPRLWLWLAGPLLAVDMLAVLGASESLYLPTFLVTIAPWLILGCIALWLAVDPRPAIALAIYLACLFAGGPATIRFAVPPPAEQMFIYAAGAALMAAAAIWRLHRQVV